MKITSIANKGIQYNKSLNFGKEIKSKRNNDYDKALLSRTIKDISIVKSGITDLLEMQYYVLKKPIHDELQKKLNIIENNLRDVIEGNNW